MADDSPSLPTGTASSFPGTPFAAADDNLKVEVAEGVAHMGEAGAEGAADAANEQQAWEPGGEKGTAARRW